MIIIAGYSSKEQEDSVGPPWGWLYEPETR